MGVVLAWVFILCEVLVSQVGAHATLAVQDALSNRVNLLVILVFPFFQFQGLPLDFVMWLTLIEGLPPGWKDC